jgi:hypothetical protein
MPLGRYVRHGDGRLLEPEGRRRDGVQRRQRVHAGRHVPGGFCVGASAVVCAPSDQCHVAGSCNFSTGQCSNPNATNGTPCNDGNACTQVDTCQSGICLGTSPILCPASDQCHSVGTCDPASGRLLQPVARRTARLVQRRQRVYARAIPARRASVSRGRPRCAFAARTNVTSAGTCDTTTGVVLEPQRPRAALPATTATRVRRVDTCQSGVCTGAQRRWFVLGFGPVPRRRVRATRARAPARTRSCGERDRLQRRQRVQRRVDTCQSGVTCVGANPVVCAVSDQCHSVGTCDTTTGALLEPVARRTGRRATTATRARSSDTCQSGVCQSGTVNPVCVRRFGSMPLGSGTCDTASGAVLEPRPRPTGRLCSDGNACTQSDTCQAGVPARVPIRWCARRPMQCHSAGVPATRPRELARTRTRRTARHLQRRQRMYARATPAKRAACTGAYGGGLFRSPRSMPLRRRTCDPASGACSNPNGVEWRLPATTATPVRRATRASRAPASGANPVMCIGFGSVPLRRRTCNSGDRRLARTQRRRTGSSAMMEALCTHERPLPERRLRGRTPVTCSSASDVSARLGG